MISTPVIGSKRGPLPFEDEFDVLQTPKRLKGGANAILVTPESQDKKESSDSTNSYNSVSNPYLSPKSPSSLNSSIPRRLVFGKESIYGKTKALLQRSCGTFTEKDGSLISRKEQFDCISNFLDQSILQHKGNSLYVTGPPGTGKTAQVDAIIRDRFSPIPQDSKTKRAAGLTNTWTYGSRSRSGDQVETVAISTINCIAVNDPSSIFHKIYSSVAEKPEGRSVRTMTDLQEFMESYSSTTTFCVVLDEMDKLVHSSLQDTNSTRMIFELFLLAKLPSIRLVLIGIANSLDMKDRFLSRLNLRQDLMPQTLVFQPYSAEQMSDIVMKRLGSLPQCIFNPMAVKYAAKRCSGNTGDLRKLFDVLRSSVEVAELERIAKKKTQQEESLTKINLQHVAKVFSQFMNHNSTKSRVHTLNMQQRTILCAIVHREKIDIFQTHCSLDDAYDYYIKFLKGKESLSPLKRNEFLEVCNALETCGVVNIFQGKSHGKTKHTVKLIKSCVDERELEQEVGKFEILKKIIAS